MLAFVDSRQAVQMVLEKYPGIQIVSDNPLLANARECRGKVDDISALLGQRQAKQLGEAGIDLLLELDQYLVECGATERYAGVSRAINITLVLRSTLCSLLHRGFVSARAFENADGPVLLAIRDELRWTPANAFLLPWYGAPQRQLAQYGFFEKVEVEMVAVNGSLPDSINDTQVDSLAMRLATAPVSHLLFQLAARLGLTFGLPGRTLYYGKRCEMLDETLVWLAARGFRLEQSLPPAYSRLDPQPYGAGKVDDPFLEKQVMPWLEEKIGNIGGFSKNQVQAIGGVLFDHLAAGLSMLPETRNKLETWGEMLVRSKTPAFLTSGLYGPLGVMAYDVLASRGIQLIDFEHGVTTGIALTSDRRLEVSESGVSDILLTCSGCSAKRFERNTNNTTSTIVPVGNADQARKLLRPSLQRYLARRRLKLRAKERTLVHVSTLIYGGNGRPGDDCPAESTTYEMDKALIETAYPQFPGTVLFKPYPANRFPDAEPYETLFSVAPNTRFIGFEDYRYIRAAADIVVTQASSSTIGWCVAGDIPLVHLQSRSMNALSGEHMYDAFSDAFFCIDTDSEGWTEELVKLLNTDAAELAREWDNKAAARQNLLKRALAGPCGTVGRRAANAIAEALTF